MVARWKTYCTASQLHMFVSTNLACHKVDNIFLQELAVRRCCMACRYAVASALAASAVPALVMARGHRIDAVPELPLVVEDGAQNLTKTSKALELLRKLGCTADIERAKASRNLRRGKGKMRNRRYVTRKGPLVVYAESGGIDKAFRNLPGVEVQCVERLNLLQVRMGCQ